MTRPYEVRKRKEPGTPYTRHGLYVHGTMIHEQLSPMSDAEIEERVRAHMNPVSVPAVRDVAGKAGRPGKKQKVTAAGFIWVDDGAQP